MKRRQSPTQIHAREYLRAKADLKRDFLQTSSAGDDAPHTPLKYRCAALYHARSHYHPHSQHLIAQGWWIAMGHLRRGCRWRHSRRAARCSSTPGSSSSCGALFSSSAGCLAAAGGECHPSVCVVAAQGWHRRARPPPTRTARFAGAVTARGPWRKRGPPAHALRLAAAARLPPKHATTLSTKIVVGRGGKCQGWQNGTPD